MKVTSRDNENGIFILIDEVLHLHIDKKGYIGLAAFIDEKEKFLYQLRIYNLSETIEVEYDSKEKWEQVLNELYICLFKQ